MSWCSKCNMDSKGCPCYLERYQSDASNLTDEQLRLELERRVKVKLIKKQNDQINKPILEEISQVEARLKHLKSKLR